MSNDGRCPVASTLAKLLSSENTDLSLKSSEPLFEDHFASPRLKGLLNRNNRNAGWLKVPEMRVLSAREVQAVAQGLANRTLEDQRSLCADSPDNRVAE